MKLTIREAAEHDILRQIEYYAERGVPDVAHRFRSAVLAAFDALLSLPNAGAQKFLLNPRLAGLRSWPVDGFDAFRIFYVADADALAIIRVLHGRRDILDILGGDTERE